MKAKKRALRTEARIKDWSEMLARGSKEAKVEHRMETRGYHKPGSNNK